MDQEKYKKLLQDLSGKTLRLAIRNSLDHEIAHVVCALQQDLKEMDYRGDDLLQNYANITETALRDLKVKKQVLIKLLKSDPNSDEAQECAKIILENIQSIEEIEVHKNNMVVDRAKLVARLEQAERERDKVCPEVVAARKAQADAPVELLKLLKT